MSDKESSCCSSLRKNHRTETEQLIKEVHKRRCLWDRSDPDYRNRARKDKAWVEIIRQFELKYDELTQQDKRELGVVITRKWNNVRDCYKKSRGSASGRRYIYADLLSFLDAVYDPALQRDLKEGAADDEHDDNDQSQEQESEWLNEVYVDMDSSVQGSAPTAKRPRTDFPRSTDYLTSEPTDNDDGIVSVLVKLIEKEEDEDRAFFKSITPAVKSLRDEDKFHFRIQVMKLLNSFKNRDRIAVKREMVTPDSDTD